MPNWSEVLEDIQKKTLQLQTMAATAPSIIRKVYLQHLHKHTGRNIICYYSGFLSKPRVSGIEITDEE